MLFSPPFRDLEIETSFYFQIGKINFLYSCSRSIFVIRQFTAFLFISEEATTDSPLTELVADGVVSHVRNGRIQNFLLSTYLWDIDKFANPSIGLY